MKPANAILRRCIYALLLLLLVLGTAELAARLLGRDILREAASPTPEKQDQAPNLQGNPYLLWELAPGVRHEMGVIVNINSLGFRGPEREIPKPAGLRRLLAVGDSSVFGFGVEDEKVFTAQLEARLGSGIEVINCAIPGYSTFQTLNLMQIRGFSYEPDVLVIASQWSDNNFDAFVDKEMMAAYSTFGNQNARKMRSLLESSHLFRILDYRLRVVKVLPKARKVGWMLGRGDHLGPRRVEINDYAVNIETLVELAHERGTEVLLMILSNQEDIEPRGEGPAAWEPYRQVLRDTATRHGAPLVDIPEVFKESRKGIGELFLDEMHPSPTGHTLMADAVERALAERGFLEGNSIERDPVPGAIPRYVDKFIQSPTDRPNTDAAAEGPQDPTQPQSPLPPGPANGWAGMKISGEVIAPQYVKGNIQIDVISPEDSTLAGSFRVQGPGPFEAKIPSHPKKINFIVYLDENMDGPGPGDRRITISAPPLTVPEGDEFSGIRVDLSSGDEIKTFAGSEGSPPPLQDGAAAPNPNPPPPAPEPPKAEAIAEPPPEPTPQPVPDTPSEPLP